MTVPRLIVIGTLIVLALDAAAFAYWLQAWPLALATPGAIGLAAWLIRRWFNRTAEVPTEGLSLGEGLDMSNPDQPKRLPVAVIPFPILNLGLLALGSPGAGKTVFTIAALRTYALSGAGAWAMFEGKGDTDIFKKACAAGARPDHFFSTELPGSETINLMDGEPFDVIDRLGRVLIGQTASTSFYSDEQRTALTRVIPLLKGLGLPVNLRDLYVVLDVAEAANELTRRAKAAGVSEDQVSLWERWLADTNPDDRRQVLKGLLNRLFIFVASPASDRLNAYQPTINVAQAVAENRRVYWHLPLSDFARDVAVAVVEMYGVEARRRQVRGAEGAPSHPLFFDDWGAFFHSNFGPISSRCRSVNMPLFFSFQSRAQLEEVARTFADILDDTTATKVIMRVQGTASARYARELLGEYDQLQVGTTQMGERDGSSYSYREASRVSGKQLREQDGGGAFVSTLARDADGRTTNALWAVRVPLPPYEGWEAIPMPEPRDHSAGSGLDFWGTYMSPTIRRQRQREALAEAEATAQTPAHEPPKAPPPTTAPAAAVAEAVDDDILDL
jgi:hypothetical protein